MQSSKSSAYEPGQDSVQPELSVVVPCYNEEEALPRALEAIVAALKAAVGDRWELIVVDDGSSDATFAIITAAHLQDDRIKGIRLSRNFGHQSAVATGLEFATGAYVGILDADLQDPPDVLIELYKKVASGECDVCVGVRGKRDAPPWLRISYHLFYQVIGRLSDPPWTRDAGDFSVFNRRVYKVLSALPEKVRSLRGLRNWVGFRHASVSYDRPARVHGTSRYNLVKLVLLALDSFVAFSNVPLRLASLAGMLMSFVTIAIAILFLINRLFPSVTLFGFWIGADPGTTTIVLYLSFISSILFFCLGMIGEYILLLLRETQGRPTSIVDSTLGLGPVGTNATMRGTVVVAPHTEEVPSS